MNESISITLPMSAITLQIPIGRQLNNVYNFSFAYCVEDYLVQTNDIKEETIDIKQEIIDITEETIDIKQEIIDITEETIDIKEEKIDYEDKVIDITEKQFDLEMDEHILHKDVNLYTNAVSPISNEFFEDVESNDSRVSEHQDENINILNKCFYDISEIVQYLKADITLD